LASSLSPELVCALGGGVSSGNLTLFRSRSRDAKPHDKGVLGWRSIAQSRAVVAVQCAPYLSFLTAVSTVFCGWRVLCRPRCRA
jgi:hypothetical protein